MPYDESFQFESIGTRYINRFAIDEQDEFEIEAIIFVDDFVELFDLDNIQYSSFKHFKENINIAVEAVKKVREHDLKGPDIHLIFL